MSGTGFDFDPDQATAQLRQSDARLRRVIDAVGPFAMELKTAPNLFAVLSEAIIYQQLSGKAAATIHGRVCALFPGGKHGPTPQQILAAGDEDLRGAGLSRPKLLALRDLASRTLAGELPTLAGVRRLDDETVIEKLTKVRGIGRWTVEMLLMFRLGRGDIFPCDDYGIRKGFQQVYRLPELPKRPEMEKHAARWQPYRSVASWYLWRALEL